MYMYTTCIYRIAGNFRGASIRGSVSQFVVYIFVVAACTAGKGSQGRSLHSWVKYIRGPVSSVHEYFAPRTLPAVR